jgi:UDP-N-acetylglucosamine--N-acetylmuramyl-(pentapeptide) pyrophosphoryl-undecaprenol N-acetylglucosamine transferase
MRIVVAGGGTAGHISPALATADALRSLDSTAELLYVGQAGGMEERIVKARGLKFAPIKAGKFRRLHSASFVEKLLNLQTLGPNAADALRTVAGVGDSLKILRAFKPDVLFLKGGFVCVPVGIAAKMLKMPFVIHESDVTPGLANRTLGKWATKIAVGFPVKSYHDFDPERLVFTGNPVRNEIAKAHRLDGLAKFRLDEKLPVVFVTGGSSGAAQINDVVVEALPRLLEFTQVIHLTGEGELERVKFTIGRMGRLPNDERYHVYGFLMGEMAAGLAVADVVLARAGANTIAELALLGKPTVLIPNYEMAGHQVQNARVLARQGAVRVLDGSKLTADELVGEVKRLVGDRDEQERLSEGIRKLAKPDAAEELAKLILSVAGEGSDTKTEHANEAPQEARVPADDREGEQE